MKQTKSRYWVGIGYPENMLDNWKEEIDEIVQVPFAYCLHNKDTDKNGELKKEHIHLILSFGGPTTYNNALAVMNELSTDGKQAFNKVQTVKSLKYMFDYLIHNTEKCKKQNKFLYDESERVLGNGFIEPAMELSKEETSQIRKELFDLTREMNFTTYGDLLEFVGNNYSIEYFDIVCKNCMVFVNVTKSNYYKELDQKIGH